MFAKQYMLKVSFPPVRAKTGGKVADEWQVLQRALPKYSCRPFSSESVSVYRFWGGTPYLEASYFELN
jgi:hypothetical protein